MEGYYFAYGSNMCTGRLRGRVDSAKPVSIAQLPGHVLRFHKRSKDGSAKADVEYTGKEEDSIWGVVLEIDVRQKTDLDHAEGLRNGYHENQLDLVDSAKRRRRVWMYVASESHKNPFLKPYSWYLRFVVEGTRQHGLPAHYIALLQQVEWVEDPNRERDVQARRISCH